MPSRRPYRRRYGPAVRAPIPASYHEYVRRRDEWTAAHPGAGPLEREAALRAISKALIRA